MQLVSAQPPLFSINWAEQIDRSLRMSVAMLPFFQQLLFSKIRIIEMMRLIFGEESTIEGNFGQLDESEEPQINFEGESLSEGPDRASVGQTLLLTDDSSKLDEVVSGEASSEGIKPSEETASEGIKPSEETASEGIKPSEETASEGIKPSEDIASEGVIPSEEDTSLSFTLKEVVSSQGPSHYGTDSSDEELPPSHRAPLTLSAFDKGKAPVDEAFLQREKEAEKQQLASNQGPSEGLLRDARRTAARSSENETERLRISAYLETKGYTFEDILNLSLTDLQGLERSELAKEQASIELAKRLAHDLELKKKRALEARTEKQRQDLIQFLLQRGYSSDQLNPLPIDQLLFFVNKEKNKAEEFRRKEERRKARELAAKQAEKEKRKARESIDRERMKAFLRSHGFSGRRLGPMSLSRMDEHIRNIKAQLARQQAAAPPPAQSIPEFEEWEEKPVIPPPVVPTEPVSEPVVAPQMPSTDEPFTPRAPQTQQPPPRFPKRLKRSAKRKRSSAASSANEEEENVQKKPNQDTTSSEAASETCMGSELVEATLKVDPIATLYPIASWQFDQSSRILYITSTNRVTTQHTFSEVLLSFSTEYLEMLIESAGETPSPDQQSLLTIIKLDLRSRREM